MKNSLEYKVLKYLADNDNGEYLNVTDLSDKKAKLKQLLTALRKEKYIESFGRFKGIPEENEYLAKIEFAGLKYLESLKPQPIPKYQKIYLPLFILFGFSTMLFAYLNYSSNNRNDILNSKADSLKIESRIYKDSVGLLKSQIELYKKQSIIDTSKTKN